MKYLPRDRVSFNIMPFNNAPKIFSPLYSDYSSSIDFVTESYFLNKYKKVPSKYECDRVDTSFFNWIKTNAVCEEICDRSSSGLDGVSTNKQFVLLPEYKSIIRITTYDKDYHSVALFYNHNKKCDALINTIHSFYKPIAKEDENKISLIVATSTGLDTRAFKIKINDMNIGYHYGELFMPIYETVLNKLKQPEEKGLILFHGEPGTGKTSLIKYLAKNIKKEVLFVPPHLGEALSQPNFLPFLLSHKNSVLVIEDAERIISDRANISFSQGVSNILNITDGILGDCMNIQIIATFNTEKSKIDSALLRKGRLIAEHKFGKLNIQESNVLLNHLGKNHIATNPMSLTEIYNIETREYKDQKNREPIGFKLN